MTLRLVSDNREPDGVLYCRHAVCRHDPGRARPATVLVTFCDKVPLPSCDECARSTWEQFPDSTRISPLSEYVDMFAAARAAALATPEQITGPAVMQVTASTIVDDEVIRHIWRDRVVYCRMRWCEEGGRLTTADQRLNAIGGPWYPACAGCIAKFDAAQVEVAPLSEADTASELEVVDKYRDEHMSWLWTKPKPPMSRRAKILWWTVPAAVLAVGITMVSIASAILSRYFNNETRVLNSMPPNVGALHGWGVFFIVVSSLVLAGVFIAYLISQGTSLPAGQFRVPRQPRAASSPLLVIADLRAGLAQARPRREVPRGTTACMPSTERSFTRSSITHSWVRSCGSCSSR